MLHYRGNAPLEEAFVGFFLDTDLGDFADDYVGSDTLLHLGYTYNADNNDERFYGLNPPALGYTYLLTPSTPDGRDGDFDGSVDESGEEQGMTRFMYYHGGGGVTEDPQEGPDYYFYLQARWKDGQPLTFGGDGRDFSATPTRFAFAGDPVTGQGWSDMNPAGDGSLPPNAPSDRRGVLITGPFRMEPGETEEIVVAIVWSRGSDHLDSVRRLKADVANLHRYAGVFLEPVPVPPYVPSLSNPVLGFAENTPNPFTDRTTLRYSLPGEASVRLAVYDVLGREVATLVNERQESGVHTVAVDASGWPPGVYLYALQIDRYFFTRRMVRLP